MFINRNIGALFCVSEKITKIGHKRPESQVVFDIPALNNHQFHSPPSSALSSVRSRGGGKGTEFRCGDWQLVSDPGANPADETSMQSRNVICQAPSVAALYPRIVASTVPLRKPKNSQITGSYTPQGFSYKWTVLLWKFSPACTNLSNSTKWSPSWEANGCL